MSGRIELKDWPASDTFEVRDFLPDVPTTELSLNGSWDDFERDESVTFRAIKARRGGNQYKRWTTLEIASAVDQYGQPVDIKTVRVYFPS